MIRKIVLACLMLVALSSHAAPPQGIELAIVPYLPARILLERYKPLRVYRISGTQPAAAGHAVHRA
jgi:hypothetical protein